MTSTPSDGPAHPGAILAWHAAMGVTTALDEAPHDRFAESAAEVASRAGSAAEKGAAGLAGSGSGGAEGFAGGASARLPAASAPPARTPSAVRAEDRARIARTPPPAPATPRPAGPVPGSPDEMALAARAAARSAPDLASLRAALEAFEGCALRATAKSCCFADGNPLARVMLVGEAPGADEDRVGRPFVGKSGQLLDRMLAAIGLDRTSVYIANTVPWRPPGNRTPTPQEMAACMPFIARQIELADPDILVCLGGPASQSLLGIKDGILKARGRWYDYDTGTRRIRALATLHPAYLLRQPLQKRSAWRDLRALRAALAAGTEKMPEPTPDQA